MENYQIIPRKYRPQRFADMVGQEAIIQTLKNGLINNLIAQAYIFCGSRGTGKTTLARLLAKVLNCKAPTSDFEPCNECISCLEIASCRSLDVIEIDGASNRGIDDIRKINETVGYSAASGKYKIYIIDEVHMLTKEAFNALLKTLEEPPKNVKFFFATTESHKILPTIISRCQRFDLNRLNVVSIKEKLKKIADEMAIKVNDEVLHQIARLSDGSLRDSESLLDQLICYGKNPITLEEAEKALGLIPVSYLFALDEAIEGHRLSFAFELAQKLFDSGKDLSAFTDSLLEHFRDLLVLKMGKNPSFLPEGMQNDYLQSAARYTQEQLLYALDFIIAWQQQNMKTSFKQLTLEMVLLHLIRSRHRLPIESIVKKLTELSEGNVSSLPSPPIEEKKMPIKEKEEVKKKEVHPSKYDTLIRFTAVELEGTVN